MVPRLFSYFAFFSVLLTAISLASAQSTHDVEPPPQLTQKFSAGITGVPPLRTFQFSTAEFDEDGNVVLMNINSSFSFGYGNGRGQKLKEGQRLKRENTIQNYVVQVPYTEIVNGESVTRTRTETKTRTIPNQSRSGGWTIVNDDGLVEEMRTQISTTYKAEQVAWFDVGGNEITPEKIKDRLQDRTPFIVIGDAASIAPYFKHILQPNAIFVVQPKESGLKFEGKDLTK